MFKNMRLMVLDARIKWQLGLIDDIQANRRMLRARLYRATQKVARLQNRMDTLSARPTKELTRSAFL